MERDKKEIVNRNELEKDLIEKIKKLSNSQTKQIDNIISGMVRFNAEKNENISNFVRLVE